MTDLGLYKAQDRVLIAEKSMGGREAKHMKSADFTYTYTYTYTYTLHTLMPW